MAIVRLNLRDEVEREVLARICDGRLAPGEHVLEVRLAGELGVSRTPLRESLVRLEREGLLTSSAGRGWRVVRVTTDDVRGVYPIIAGLEAVGLELVDSGDLSALADRLDQKNEAFLKVTGDPVEAQRADDEWHFALIEPCGNDRVITMVQDLKRIVHRCEYAYMGEVRSVVSSWECHRDIAGALRLHDMPVARQLLRQNWLGGMEAMCEWLEGKGFGSLDGCSSSRAVESDG